jgi:cell division protein YceG involved in septum cleavage
MQDIKVIPPEKPKKKKKKSRLYTITSFLIVVLVIILIVYQLYRKKQKDLERELELKTYITNSLARGFTKQQLKQGLLKEGWNKRLVDKAFNNLMEPRKLSKLESLELQNYINNALRRGYKKQQIKQELLNEGWHERQIDEALKNNRML